MAVPSCSAATPASARPPSSAASSTAPPTGSCSSATASARCGTSLPYLPFVEMVAGLDARDRELVDELVAAHPGLVPLVPRLAGGVRGDAVRADLVEAVHGALADLGRRGPVLVVVEDVHWADESTRELLTLLFTRGGPDGVGSARHLAQRRHPPPPPPRGRARRVVAAARTDPCRARTRSRTPTCAASCAGSAPTCPHASSRRSPAARRATPSSPRSSPPRRGTGGADPGDLTRLLLTRVDQLDDGAQSRGAGRGDHRPPRPPRPPRARRRGRCRHAAHRVARRHRAPRARALGRGRATSSGTRCSPRP